ncbi:MAG TPA: nucleotidyltransferase domain-containing protein [Sedimentisphaerales bacterium]|nr:nucleotidyltransferase domain-containing protein [Sedimentisphaerales bacterium]HRS11248.1 nucleotidyltransferase domain-containing protein [Sedimentisphaerales bacterium]HRV47826.1 nucleotidyltransferase domain-containing protein [Sedimentisphaerales bacterium]
MKAESDKERMAIAAASGSKPIDLQHLAAVLSDVPFIDYAMVFGSARDGVAHAGSDLDVAVSLADADAKDFARLVEIVGRVEETFDVPCDLTVLNTAGPVLRHEALKGRVLFVRPGRQENFADFFTRTCAEYEDLMALRARQLAYRGY